ncbi:PAS domain S-box protein [Candidatus Contubernalis alkaliaceticus]|uniref:PAS domain S-box protein n=1 Tax=Candidatus Contubernalis alkaliaceticus TaxID=338645 RepID=UPI001F4C2D38|nr:PAS domain S-box protein [Candidatus Contubernalis alkalaceticus]UNC91979.1 PAS domain S-box protein [Candidatus Contubernalis alkalaceticus]
MDITNKHKSNFAEQNLLYDENLELLRTLVNSMGDVLYTLDCEQRYVGIFGSWTNHMGLTPENCLGKTNKDIFKYHNTSIHDTANQLALKGEKVVYEWKLKGPKKIHFFHNVLTPILDSQGNTTGIVGVGRDITQLKLTQNKFAAEKEQLAVTLRSIGDGVITTDTKGKISLINQAAEGITGWNQKEVQGKHFAEIFCIINENNKQVCQDPLGKLIDNNNKKTAADYITFVARNNARKIISANATPIKDNKNSIIGYVIVFRDITEQKKTEAQFALLQKLNSIGQLAAGIAHEINTPMQYIGDNTRFIQHAFNNIYAFRNYYKQTKKLITEINMSKLISDIDDKEIELDIEYLIKEIPKAVNQSLEGIDRVSKLVLAMKEFAHPGTKEKIPSDLNRAIENTLTISRSEWKYIADIETELEQNLPMVWCVIDEINQVFLNIIVNAAQAIEEAIEKKYLNKGVITVKTKSDGAFVFISIKDNGIGIPGDIIDKIFDPFFTTKDIGKGTGQGLLIAYDIISNKHNGSIEVNSKKVGKGTTFTIRLPIDNRNTGEI